MLWRQRRFVCPESTPYVHLPLLVITSPRIAMFVRSAGSVLLLRTIDDLSAVLQTRTRLRHFELPLPLKGNTPSGQGREML